MASLGSFSEKIEPVFLLTSVAFGAAALIPAYRKRHGRLSCIVLFTCGIACLLLRKLIDFGGAIPEVIGTGIGAALIITSHALNMRFSKRCPCCEPDGKEGSERASAAMMSAPAADSVSHVSRSHERCHSETSRNAGGATPQI